MSATETYDMYWGAIEAMLLDDEISGDIELRRSVALSMPWHWEGSDNAKENMKRLLSYIDFDEFINVSLRHVEYGFNPIELDWTNNNGNVYPTSFSARAPRLFRVGEHGQLYYCLSAFEPQAVSPGKVIVFVRNASREKPYGESLLESVWPIWQVKWNHVTNLDRLGEKYAIPSIVALMTDGANNQPALDSVSYSLAQVDSGSSVALAGVKDIVELSISGKATELLDVIKMYDNKICKRITGQTLSTGNQQYGSRSLGETYERATLRLTASDLKLVINTLNLTLVRWLKELNPTTELPIMKFDEIAFQAMAGAAIEPEKKEPVVLSNSADNWMSLCL